jgi:hypothetical protein
MHRAPNRETSDTDCSVRSAHVPSDALLLALDTGLGLLPVFTDAPAELFIEPIEPVSISRVDRSILPHAPPPKN